jgi:tetratricopeptide (TPR) repeat protein
MKQLFSIAALLTAVSITAQEMPKDRFFIASDTSGMVLDVNGGATHDGAFFITYAWHGQENQQLRLISAPGGWFQIESIKSRKYLDIADDGSLIIRAKHNGDSQLWRLTKEAGALRIESKTGRALTDGGRAEKYGNRVIAVTPREGSAWRLWIYGSTPWDLQKKAQELWKAGKTDEALAIWKRATASSPRLSAIAREYWRNLLRVERYQEALAAVQEYRSNGGIDDAHTELILGQVNEKTGNPDVAIPHFRESAKRAREALAATRTDDAETRAQRGCYGDAYAGMIRIAEQRFALDTAESLMADYFKTGIATDHYELLKAAIGATVKLMLRAYGNAEYDSALKYNDSLHELRTNRNATLAEADRRGSDTALYRDLISRRRALGAIQPEYTQTIKALYIRRFAATYRDTAGRERRIDSTLLPHEEQWCELMQNAMSRTIETYTKGKFSVSFRRFGIDAPMRGYTVTELAHPELRMVEPHAGRILYDDLSNTDIILTYWKSADLPNVKNYGGNAVFPIIPWQVDTPVRGLMTIVQNGSLALHLHEHFHTVERSFNLKTQDVPANRKEYVPDALDPDKHALYYYEQMYSKYLPALLDKRREEGDPRGWRITSFSANHPFRMSEAQFAANARAAELIPPGQRKKATELKVQADALWRAGRKEEADRRYTEAFSANPHFFDYYRHFGDRALEKRDYEKAVDLYRKYATYAHAWWLEKRIGDLLAFNLNRHAEAIPWYDCVLVANSSSETESDKIRFNKGICLIETGKRQEGIALVRSSYTEKLRTDAWYRRMFERYTAP